MKNVKFNGFISFILAAALILVSFGFCFADGQNAEDETLHYVSMGNSNTCGYCFKEYCIPLFSGINHMGYRMECSKIYPYLFMNYLEDNLATVSAVTGKNYSSVSIDQIALVGWRVQDYRYMLEYGQPDAYQGDQITEIYKNCEPLFGTLTQSITVAAMYSPLNKGPLTTEEAVRAFSEDMIEAVKTADIISIEEGANEIGNYSVSKIRFGYDTDLDAALKDAGIPFNYDDAYELVSSLLKEYGIIDLSDYDAERNIIETIVADYIEFCVNYEALLGDIYALNPDVKILVLGLNYCGMSYTHSVSTYSLSTAEYTPILKALATGFETGISRYKDRIVFVKTDEAYIEDFGDEARGSVSDYSEDLKMFFDYQLKENYFSDEEFDLIASGAGEISLEEIYENMKYIFNASGTGNKYLSSGLANKEDCRNYLLGKYTGSELSLVKNTIYTECFLLLLMYRSHPNAAGHMTKFECLRDAFESDLSGSEVLAERTADACDYITDTIHDSFINLGSQLRVQHENTAKQLSESFELQISNCFKEIGNIIQNNIESCLDNIAAYFNNL